MSNAYDACADGLAVPHDHKKFTTTLYNRVDRAVIKDINVPRISSATHRGGFQRTRLYILAYFQDFKAFKVCLHSHPYLNEVRFVNFKMDDPQITEDDFKPSKYDRLREAQRQCRLACERAEIYEEDNPEEFSSFVNSNTHRKSSKPPAICASRTKKERR
jgi:hypothetical protein